MIEEAVEGSMELRLIFLLLRGLVLGGQWRRKEAGHCAAGQLTSNTLSFVTGQLSVQWVGIILLLLIRRLPLCVLWRLGGRVGGFPLHFLVSQRV